MRNTLQEQHCQSCCKPDCCRERNEKGARRDEMLLKTSEQLKRKGDKGERELGNPEIRVYLENLDSLPSL